MRTARRTAASVVAAILAAVGLVAIILTSPPSSSARSEPAATNAQPARAQVREQAQGQVQPVPRQDDDTPWRPESTACPAMTDSINRLFEAFFNRPPDGAEFVTWTSRYRSGDANLAQIADELARSREFVDDGDTSDRDYVEFVYRSVLRRAPSDEDQLFWEQNLATGYSRGAMMIAFSESEAFVRRTETVAPMAGYLKWYPEGVHWYCGVGSRRGVTIRPLTDQTVYADYLFHNGGNVRSPVGMQTLINSSPHLTLTTGSIPAGLTSYRWDGRFTGDGGYGTALDVAVGPDTSWIVVFYPRSIGAKRLGWQLDP